MDFYRLSISETAATLKTDIQRGLEDADATERLRRFAPNRIEPTNRRPPWRIFVEQFKDLLVVILIGAGCISLYMAEYRDAVLMFGIVMVNTVIRFYQEYRSEKILDALINLMIPEAKVVRGGQVREISAAHLVPGDLVVLEEGDGVPADIRLVESGNFATNDFLLTGETSPQPKSHTLEIRAETPLTSQDNCVFSGVTVARGAARGIVFATGMNSEIGKIAAGSEEIVMTPSPLQREIGHLARRITQIALVIMLCLFAAKLLLASPLREALVFAIGVAAAMVPEGMATQISVALALGVGRLARRNAVVKKLSAIETLGSATVIATDKTGTITRNEMTVNHCHFGERVFFISGEGYAPEGEIVDTEGNSMEAEEATGHDSPFIHGFLASTGRARPPDAEHRTWYPLGDPTDAAFATLALKAGFNLDTLERQHPRLELFPFDTERKRLSIIREHEGTRTLYMKGAPETVLAACSNAAHNETIVPLDETGRARLLNLARGHAIQSLRVLALARKGLASGPLPSREEAETGLTFVGIVTMMDPLHHGVRQAVQAAYDAKMKVVMITGDTGATAKAVAHTIGMKNENGRLPDVMDGDQLSRTTDDALGGKFGQRSMIFSRVTPADKLRIVALLKRRGEVVAVTGDGVNDVLSLKRADIGVAMGMKGSEVAREAADIVLLDDNFNSIVTAIREGRTIYRNLEKTIVSSLTANFGELSCILMGFIAGFWGTPIPLLAVQILAVDLIGEYLPLMFLTYDPPDTGLMTQPPRPLHRHIIRRDTLPSIVFFGILMGLAAFCSFTAVYYLHTHETLHYERALAASYSTIVLCQFMNILSRRTRETIFTDYLFSNGRLLAAFAASALFVLAIVYLPALNPFFHTAPLSPSEWQYPIVGAAVFLLVYEAKKRIFPTVNSS